MLVPPHLLAWTGPWTKLSRKKSFVVSTLISLCCSPIVCTCVTTRVTNLGWMTQYQVPRSNCCEPKHRVLTRFLSGSRRIHTTCPSSSIPSPEERLKWSSISPSSAGVLLNTKVLRGSPTTRVFAAVQLATALFPGRGLTLNCGQ